MPKVLGYTPSWLSRPSPGFRLFTSPQGKQLSKKINGKDTRRSTNGGSKKEEYVGPSRLIARRGTEIFVVVDNTIRWSDLCMLKDVWEEREQEDNRYRSPRKNEVDQQQNGEEGFREDCYKVGYPSLLLSVGLIKYFDRSSQSLSMNKSGSSYPRQTGNS